MSQRDTVNTRPLDTSTPDAARIMDHLLGGAANFEVDRTAAEQLLALVPALRKWSRLQRAFIQEAALRLYESGIDPFFDLGSGLPTQDHLPTAVPSARVVDSDSSPMAISNGNSLLAARGNVALIYGDITNLARLLAATVCQRLINPARPITIGLNSSLLSLAVPAGQALLAALYVAILGRPAAEAGP